MVLTRDLNKSRERKKRWRVNHKEQNREIQRKWRENNPSYMKEYFQKEIKSDQEKYEDVMKKFTNTFYKYKEQWKKIRKELGYDRCSICGYDKCQAAIEYHHPNPETKKLPPWQIFHHKPVEEWINVLKELVPLCSNCHREIHHLHTELKLEEE